MHRKRVLFLTPWIPYPPNGGGVYVSYRTLLHINASYDTTVFILDKTGDENSTSALGTVLRNCRVYSLCFKRDRTTAAFLASILANKPLAVFRNYSPKAKLMIEKLAADADVIVVDHYLMFQYVPKWFQGRVVVLTHNAEFLLWERALEYVNSVKRIVLKYEAGRVRKYESEMLREADAVGAFGNDLKAFLSLGCGVDKLVERLPFGDEESLKLPEIDFARNGPIALFLGTLSWEPNINGIRWFLQNCWPQVRTVVPNAEFWIGGIGGRDSMRSEFTKLKGVKYLGFIEDIEKVYAKSRVFVAPMRFGAGIKIKVLNAMFRGLPVVCTACGAEGLGCDNGEGVWVTEEPLQYAKYVSKLLTDANLCLNIAVRGREFARLSFTGCQLTRGIDFAICGDET